MSANPKLTVVAAVIEKNGRILIAQRKATRSHPGKWEFPGGKVEPDEIPRAALQRELNEELGMDAEIGPEEARYSVAYGGSPPIDLLFYRVTAFRGQPSNLDFAQIAWVDPARLPDYDFLEGDVALVKQLSSTGLTASKLLSSTPMNYFLAKTDPETYSIDDLEREKKTAWDGVTNPQAVRAIKEMRPGDRVFIYHSGGVSGVVGIAEVVSQPRPDPNNAKSAVVDLEFAGRIEPPMTLKEIKGSGQFDDWALVRQGRLSTMPAPAKFLQWMRKRYPAAKI